MSGDTKRSNKCSNFTINLAISGLLLAPNSAGSILFFIQVRQLCQESFLQSLEKSFKEDEQSGHARVQEGTEGNQA